MFEVFLAVCFVVACIIDGLFPTVITVFVWFAFIKINETEVRLERIERFLTKESEEEDVQG